MLRNLHLAHQRRANRNRFVQLSIVEYDSAEIGLGVVNLRDRLAALGDLLTIKLLESLREEKSGVYGVNATGLLRKFPPEDTLLILVLRARRKTSNRLSL